MYKSSGVFSAFSSLVNHPILNNISNVDQFLVNPLETVIHKNEHGRLAAKGKLTYGDIPLVGGFLGANKQQQELGGVNRFYQNHVRNSVDRLATRFNNLDSVKKEKLTKVYGHWRKANDHLGNAQMISLAGDLAGVGQPKMPKPLNQQIGHNHSVGLKLDRIEGASMLDPQSVFYDKRGISLNKITHPERYKSEANALTGMIRKIEKVGSYKQSSLRRAYDMEIPYLFKLCLDHEKEFMINSDSTMKMAADRLLNQDTFIHGDLMELKGFINGGYREIPNVKTASTPYYLRFIYVNPESKGQGLAKEMIDEVLSKSASKEYWMQICEENSSMQKVANRCNFQKIYTFDQGGQQTGVWYRRDP